MLCKAACKCCVNTRSCTKWDTSDDLAWHREYIVTCPSEICGRWSQVIHIWQDAPEWCPYELEHMLNENDMAEEVYFLAT